MKTNVAAMMLVLISSTAFAALPGKWLPLSSSMFVLRSHNDEKIMLSAGLDARSNDVAFRILDLSGILCKPGVSKPLSIPPISINGKHVRVMSVCINGSQLISPETPEGTKYFSDLVNSGEQITIETGLGPNFGFKGAPPTDLRSKLLSAKTAM